LSGKTSIERAREAAKTEIVPIKRRAIRKLGCAAEPPIAGTRFLADVNRHEPSSFVSGRNALVCPGKAQKQSGRLVESNRHSAFRHEAIVDEDDAASFLARMDDLHAVGEQS
jgi:hypothetical protein